MAVVLIPNASLTRVVEGDPITFRAILHLSDKSERDVTKEVAWRVLGTIGTVDGGVFMPRLVPDVQEYGQSSGAVVASWSDQASGMALLGQTEVFEVHARVDATPRDELRG